MDYDVDDNDVTDVNSDAFAVVNTKQKKATMKLGTINITTAVMAFIWARISSKVTKINMKTMMITLMAMKLYLWLHPRLCLPNSDLIVHNLRQPSSRLHFHLLLRPWPHLLSIRLVLRHVYPGTHALA